MPYKTLRSDCFATSNKIANPSKLFQQLKNHYVRLIRFACFLFRSAFEIRRVRRAFEASRFAN